MSLDLSLGLGIPQASLGTLLNYLSSLIANYKTRTLNKIAESKTSYPATVEPVIGRLSSYSYLTRAESEFGGTDLSGYVEFGAYMNGNVITAFSVTNSGISSRRFGIELDGRFLTVGYVDTVLGTDIVRADLVSIRNGYHIFKISSDGTIYKFYCDGIEQTAIIVGGANDGNWIGDLAQVTNTVSIGATIIPIPTYSDNAYISYVDYSGLNKWILNTKSGFAYDVIGGKHLTWAGVGSHYKYDENGSSYLLDNGYSIWKHATEPDIHVPFSSLGAALALTAGTNIPAGYTMFADIAGSAGHNLADSNIKFQHQSTANRIFDLLTNISKTLNTNSGTRTFIGFDDTLRIRQDGFLRGIKFCYIYSANTTVLKLQVWRNIVGTFTRLANIDILTEANSKSEANKIIDVSFDKVSVLQGDYLALVAANSGVTNILSTTGNVCTGKYTDSEVDTAFEWTAATDLIDGIHLYAIMDSAQIIGLGDSIVYGGGFTSPTESILGGLKTINENLSYNNYGLSGQKTATLLSKYNAVLGEKKSRYALLNGGTNDVNQADTATTVANVVSIIDKCIADGIYPIYFLIIPATDFSNEQHVIRESLNAAIVSACASKDCLIVSLESTLGVYRAGGADGNLWDLNPALKTDGLHPNAAGYALCSAKIYAEMIAKGLKIYSVPQLNHFDRSNTTIASAASRASSYYNKLKPYSFNVSELKEFDTYNGLFEADYQDEIFVKTEGSSIDEILQFPAKQITAALAWIKNYCGII